MAYEHGSLDLGIRNPFRFEGTIRAFRGALTSILAILILMTVPEAVAKHQIIGWATTSVGFILLANGLWAFGSGLMMTLRFFVGRSVPTSLAPNHAKSEADSARAELNNVAYDADQMEQMLVGRKNLTFTEPKGLIGRLIHTLFPRLTFVPYPIRNMAQQLTDTLTQTVLALVMFGLASFIIGSGLIGHNGVLIAPLLSTLLLFYLISIWFSAGRAISRGDSSKAQSKGAVGIARTVILAVSAPIALSFAINSAVDNSRFFNELLQLIFTPREELRGNDLTVYGFFNGIWENLSNFSWLLVLAGLATLSCVLIGLLIRGRLSQANPITEVSELRENWQESVHPREIFINLDSMVMANRRYKEVPNRIYRSMKPMLKEQSNGKGAFYGETIQETQPRVRANNNEGRVLRILGTTLGQVLMLACAGILFMLLEPVVHLLSELVINQPDLPRNMEARYQLMYGFGEQFAFATNLIIGLLVFGLFGRLLTNLTHVFWSELKFESMLIYFKCEGTYTESTISTGKGIYDSTQSENIVVRSSMTPWVIVSNVVSSTFCGVGSQNLEQPRHLLELHSNEEDMSAVISDLRGYLASRQTIVGLNTDADMKAAAQINEINQQTRAIPMQNQQSDLGALSNNQQQLEDHNS